MPNDTKNVTADSQETLERAKRFLAEAQEKLREVWQEISRAQIANEQSEHEVAERLRQFVHDIEALREKLEQESRE